MDPLLHLSEHDYENLAEEIERLSNENENDIFEIIGKSIESAGFAVYDPDLLPAFKGFANQDLGSENLLYPKMMIDKTNRRVDARAALEFVKFPISSNMIDLKQEGKNFWARFNKILKKEICTNVQIQKIMTGDGTLKEYLIIGIPIIMAALGLTALNPAMLVLITSIFALIIKVGFKTYCEID